MNMTREKQRSISSLEELWTSLLEPEALECKEVDDDFQGLMMLLETATRKVKGLSFCNFNLKAANDRILSELDWKTQEYNKLKIEITRLENSPCQRCSSLEAEMKSLRKKAVEAHSRMKSIANILKLGENIEDSQSPRKNSALTLVSQMLLEESPRRKKRCLPKTAGLWKETNDSVALDGDTTLVPEEAQKLGNGQLAASLVKANVHDDGADIISSPGCETVQSSKSSLTIKLRSLNKESPRHAKRNLSTSFEQDVSKSPNKSIKIIPETEHNSSELNGSLDEYVRDSNAELEKIWFSGNSSKLPNKNSDLADKDNLPSEDLEEETIIKETPERTPLKKKAAWKMREMRGPSEQAGSRKMRQMTLSLTHKHKAKDVDLTTLSGFDGGSLDSSERNCLPSGSMTVPKERDNSAFPLRGPSLEVGSSEIDSLTFQPAATSTQKVDLDLMKRPKKKEGGSSDYKYKGETVRKKSEREKLEGWDCTACAEYYAACGVTSPSELKGRINKCSRHRAKFRPDNNTPPGYWDPIFPDTDECKRQGMYTSYRCRKDD